jgi:putative flippase GtrA
MSSGWRAEAKLLQRYVGVGAINTLVGFVVIFALTWQGASPWIANASGYGVGLAVGFLLSRTLVFGAGGALGRDGARYLMAFALAYLANLAVLRISLEWMGLSPYGAQLLAAVTYTGAMYLLCRHVVFSSGRVSR